MLGRVTVVFCYTPRSVSSGVECQLSVVVDSRQTDVHEAWLALYVTSIDSPCCLVFHVDSVLKLCPELTQCGTVGGRTCFVVMVTTAGAKSSLLSY